MRTITDRNAPYQGIAQASFVSGMSQYYIRQGILNGTIPHIRSGNKYLVNVPAFIEQLNQQSQNATR